MEARFFLSSTFVEKLQSPFDENHHITPLVPPSLPPSLLSHSVNFKITGGQVKEFTFHKVFGPESSQEALYTQTTLPLVDALWLGKSGLLFAYGVTNAGNLSFPPSLPPSFPPSLLVHLLLAFSAFSRPIFLLSLMVVVMAFEKKVALLAVAVTCSMRSKAGDQARTFFPPSHIYTHTSTIFFLNF